MNEYRDPASGLRQARYAAAAKALADNHFAVSCVADRLAAVAAVLELVAPADLVAFGGSQTVAELDLIPALQQRHQPLLLQEPGMDAAAVRALRRKALTADVYIASPNAVTADGKLLFVDKNGNRAAAMIFGPGRILVVAGWNKIVDTEAAAGARISGIAAPRNAQRLGASTPCARTGCCSDCAAPDRLCNIAVTLRKKPAATLFDVVLVAEDLGF
jgi:hypothetical protein